VGARNPNNTATHKQCPNCGRVLDRRSFPANSYQTDGLYGWCRACTYERNKKYAPPPTGKPRGRPRRKPKVIKLPSKMICSVCGKESEPSEKWWGETCHECREMQRIAKKKESSYRRNEVIKSRRKEIKAKCVALLGDKCARCGYNEFHAGLDFHHLGDKLEDISLLIMKCGRSGRSWERLHAELSKCVLLCRNCHMALHSGHWLIQDLANHGSLDIEPGT
jgi:hypothetical protein